MRIEDVVDRGPKLKELDIARYEALAGINLPSDYRSFLLVTNGGAPADKTGWFRKMTRTKRKWSHLRYFYALRRRDVQEWTLAGALRTFRDRVNSEAIPIGTDEFGNQILLVVRGSGAGSVYFWSHEWDEADIKLASSFAEFLDQLQEDIP